jgi:hypothetical protein
MNKIAIEVTDKHIHALKRNLEVYKASKKVYPVLGSPALTTNVQSESRWRCEVAEDFLVQFPCWEKHVVHP